MTDRIRASRARSAGLASALSVALAVSSAAMAQQPAGQSQTKSSGSSASAAEAEASKALIRTVEAFTKAQQSFDAARLALLTTPDYLEISPLGAVDSRERMLAVYAPEKKIAAPELAMSDVTVRRFGIAAVLIARIAYSVQPPGQPARTVELRASFVAHRASGDWKIASAHYTGIRPAAN